MKRLSLFLAFILIAVIAMTAKTYVVAAGVANYYDTQNRLNYPAQDATEVAKQLKKAGCSVTLLTSKNATHDNILAAVRKIAKSATSKDRFVFFYSGHGAEGLLCTYDDPSLKNTVLTYNELADELAKMNAGQVAVFINSCHSGSVQNSVATSDWQAKAKHSNMVFILSSEASEYSIESNWSAGGYFTRSLINCFHGLCDANKDRKVTYKEMYDYIYDDVVRRSKGEQHPVLLHGPNMLNAVFMKW